MTSSVSAPKAALSLGITGNPITSSVANPVAALSLGLTGNPITSSVSAPAPGLTVALGAQSITSSVSAPTSSVAGGGLTAGLSSQSITSSVGALTPALDLGLTGQTVTTSVSNPTSSVFSGYVAALSPNSSTFSPGVVTPSLDLGVSGSTVNSSVGTLTPSVAITVPLSSQTANFSTQTVVPALTTGLSSQNATFGVGSLGVPTGDITVALDPVLPATFDVGLLQVASAVQAKSGVSRQWLIDYYTEAFAKKEKPVDIQGLAKAKTAAARKKLIRAAEVAEAQEIEKLVVKAESDLEVLTRGIKDSQAAQEFTYNLLNQAKHLLAPEVDFLTVAEQYQNRIREDDELLLLSMIL